MLIIDLLKVNICGTREFNINAQKSVFHNIWNMVVFIGFPTTQSMAGFSKESIVSLVLVTSQHHIESDNMKVIHPLLDLVSQRDQDNDLQAKPMEFVSDLAFTASTVWRSQLARHLPFQNFQVPIYQHICNIYLGICIVVSPYICCSEEFEITGLNFRMLSIHNTDIDIVSF